MKGREKRIDNEKSGRKEKKCWSASAALGGKPSTGELRALEQVSLRQFRRGNSSPNLERKKKELWVEKKKNGGGGIFFGGGGVGGGEG